MLMNSVRNSTILQLLSQHKPADQIHGRLLDTTAFLVAWMAQQEVRNRNNKKYPNDWLPFRWAAHVHCKCTLFQIRKMSCFWIHSHKSIFKWSWDLCVNTMWRSPSKLSLFILVTFTRRSESRSSQINVQGSNSCHTVTTFMMSLYTLYLRCQNLRLKDSFL